MTIATHSFIAPASILLFLCVCPFAAAQISSDGTLGTQVAPGTTTIITGGTTSGTNLFHSFGEFSVPLNGTAYFNNDASILNIIGRITGGSISEINGIIQANGNASLFLLNPVGIIFGPNASLNIGGSFTASTDTRLLFADGNSFSAIATPNPPILSLAQPIGLGLGSDSLNTVSGNISNAGTLAVRQGQALTLIGNTVTNTGSLVPDATNGATNVNVEMAGRTIVNSGSIAVGAGNITLSADNLQLLAPGTLVGTGNLVLQPLTPSLDFTIGGTGDASSTFLSSAEIERFNTPGNSGLGGFQRIAIGRDNSSGTITATGSLFFTDPLYVRSPVGSGSINASQTTIYGFNNASVTFEANQNVSAGNIYTFFAGLTNPISLISRNGAIVANGLVTGGGNQSDITLSAYGDITVTNQLESRSNTNTKSGDIILTSQVGNINTSQAKIDSGNFATCANNTCDGGQISFSALGNIRTGTIASFAYTGRAGDVWITSRQGTIDTSAGAIGTGGYAVTAGSVVLNAPGTITTGAIGTTSNAFNNAVGGDILIVSRDGEIRALGNMTSTVRSGRSGDVNLNAKGNILTQNITLDGRYAGPTSIGNGGNIIIASSQGGIQTQALTTQSSEGQGGSISLAAAGSIQTTTLRSDGRQGSGDITLLTQTPYTLTNQLISTTTTGSGEGADITIIAPTITIDGGRIKTGTTGSGDSGDIWLQARNVEVRNQGELSTTTTGAGEAGAITIGSSTNPADRIYFRDRSFASTGPKQNATGSGGTISLYGQTVLLEGGSVLNTASDGAGNAGDIFIEATEFQANTGSTLFSSTAGDGQAGIIALGIDRPLERITFSGESTAVTRSDTGATGSGGSIILNGRSVNLNDRSRLDSSTASAGDAGAILVGADTLNLTQNSRIQSISQGTGVSGFIGITTTGTVTLDQSGITTQLLGDPQNRSNRLGGGIEIEARSLTLNNNSFIDSSTNQEGVAGEITLQIQDQLALNRSEIRAEVEGAGTGTGGDVRIQARSLTLADQSRIKASTTGSGPAGNLEITASESVRLTGNSALDSEATATSTGEAGSVSITTPKLTLTNSLATVENKGTNYAGNLIIQSQDINLNQSQLTASNQSAARGEAFGNLQLNGVRTLTLDRSTISSSTAIGQAGTVSVNRNETPADAIALDNQSRIEAAATQAGGRAGGVELNTRRLTVTDGSAIFATNIDSPIGGNISLPNLTTLDVDNSLISTSTQTGQAGDVNITAARSVELSGSYQGKSAGIIAEAIASTGKSAAGTVTINTGRLSITNNAQATVSNQSRDPNSSAGDLEITANSVTLDDRGKLTANTIGGEGGNVSLRLRGDLDIDDAGEISTTTETGKAGAVNIRADNLTLSDAGLITSRSTGTGSAGKITIVLDNNFASSAGEISAASELGGGGQIAISAKNILLTNNSLINTSVFDGKGGGGDIQLIVSDRFFAFLNSDILANAVQGDGGNIDIQAPIFLADLFANVGRNPGNNFSALRRNGRVDISASSRFGVSGTVTIPDFSFLQNALSELSGDLVNADQLIAGSCIARRHQSQGRFVVTGTGGLPIAPEDPLVGRYRIATVQGLQNPDAPPQASQPPKPPAWRIGQPIREAKGLVATADGRLILASSPQSVVPIDIRSLLCDPH